jgi:GNAT superfamily N-acetyltransferase
VASAKLYTLEASLDGRPLRIFGIGALFTAPAHRGRGHARALVERLLERAAGEGATVALLFSIIGARLLRRSWVRADRNAGSLDTGDRRHEAGSADDARPRRRGSRSAGHRRHGTGPRRALPVHLERDRDFAHFAIVRKRLLAGLSPAGDREVQFFVAEEGSSAVAYVVITVRGGRWVLEECGDRDPAGARVGAILQVLIARDPSAARPAITTWLPADFRPPQIEIVGERPSSDIMMMRGLGRSVPKFLDPADWLYWHGDMF